MKTLFLLRHARAENAQPGSSDFDRTLDESGKKAAQAAGVFVGELHLKFDLVLCSTAVRASETAELAIAAAGLKTTVRYDKRIYEAAPLRLLEVVREVETETVSLLLIGHNPGLEDLLKLLTGQNVPMATCSLAKLDLEIDQWSDIGEAGGTLDWIVKPEKLHAS
ncbi:MAG TPA: histidine phosphatase family protein [Pyrinomonadaceae bacterium]|jgi:phosphohistidine phosphatase|nr:histidine phosphatase family protein [Pyrinomonadaceae bacterium]